MFTRVHRITFDQFSSHVISNFVRILDHDIVCKIIRTWNFLKEIVDFVVDFHWYPGYECLFLEKWALVSPHLRVLPIHFSLKINANIQIECSQIYCVIAYIEIQKHQGDLKKTIDFVPHGSYHHVAIKVSPFICLHTHFSFVISV